MFHVKHKKLEKMMILISIKYYMVNKFYKNYRVFVNVLICCFFLKINFYMIMFYMFHVKRSKKIDNIK